MIEMKSLVWYRVLGGTEFLSEEAAFKLKADGRAEVAWLGLKVELSR